MLKLLRRLRQRLGPKEEERTESVRPPRSDATADLTLARWGGDDEASSTATSESEWPLDPNVGPNGPPDTFDVKADLKAGPKFTQLTVLQRFNLLTARKNRIRQRRTTEQAREVERRQRLLERNLGTGDKDQIEHRRAIKARNRALILSGQVLPRKEAEQAPGATLQSLESLTYEFQSGGFDRKPDKQRGWNLKLAPSRQSEAPDIIQNI